MPIDDTLLFSQDIRIRFDADTLLVATWFHIPPWGGDLFSGPQVFWIYDDASGSFIELGFFDGIMDFMVYLHDSSHGIIVGDGSAILDDPQLDYYNLTGWNNIAISIQFSTQTIQILLNGTLINTSSVVWNTNTPLLVPNGAELTLATARYAPGFAIGDYYLTFNEPFFDLTNPANRAKLWTSDNTPVDWGPYGENITGSQPMVFLSGTAENYLTNYGYGGAWQYPNRPSIPLMDYTDIPGPGCVVVTGRENEGLIDATITKTEENVFLVTGNPNTKI